MLFRRFVRSARHLLHSNCSSRTLSDIPSTASSVRRLLGRNMPGILGSADFVQHPPCSPLPVLSVLYGRDTVSGAVRLPVDVCRPIHSGCQAMQRRLRESDTAFAVIIPPAAASTRLVACPCAIMQPDSPCRRYFCSSRLSDGSRRRSAPRPSSPSAGGSSCP